MGPVIKIFSFVGYSLSIPFLSAIIREVLGIPRRMYPFSRPLILGLFGNPPAVIGPLRMEEIPWAHL